MSRQILVGVFTSVLTAIALLSLLNYALVSRRIVIHAQQEVDSLALNTSQALQSFFKQRMNDLDAVLESPLVSDYYKSRDFGLAQEADSYRKVLEDYFIRVGDRAQVYYDIFLVNSSGRRLCSMRGLAGLLTSESTLSVASLLALQRGSRLDLEPERLGRPGGDGPFIKRYTKPVFDPNAVFLGALVLDLDMRHVEEVLGKVRVGTSGSAFLEDEDGKVIVGVRPGMSNPLMATRSIPETRWKLGVAARPGDFLEPLARIRNLTFFFAVLAAGVVMGLVMWRITALLKPVQDMVEGTRRFAAGEMTYRIEQPRILELRTLADSFNKMAESLEIRGHEIEKQLRQLRALREMEEGVIERDSEAKILVNCLQAVAKAFGFDRTALYWVEEKRGVIIGKAMYGAEPMGFNEARFKERMVPLGADDILNEVIRTRQPVIIRDVDLDPRLNREFIEETKTREFALAPICGKEKVLGVLTADNYFTSRPLDEADKEGLRVFANAVGLAMENVGLFESLRESEAKYRAVLENSPEAVMGLSKEFWINTWNRGAEKIFGWTAAEVVGKPLSILFSADQYSDYQAMVSKVTTSGPLKDYVVKGSSKAGGDLDLSVSWGGALENFWMNKEWTMVIRDVTEAKRMQQQLIRSEKLSAVGQLISGIAHELNNPLQAVVGYADLLTEEVRGTGPVGNKAEDSVLSDLKIITDNAMRCQKIIENLLLFVRQGEIVKKPIDLGRVSQAAVDLLHYKLKKAANIDVSIEISPLLAKARGNFQQLQQVFVNLINNATDAMSGQAGPRTIKITAVENNHVIRAEVADSGPGIPESVRDRLFEPFFTTKGEGRGTGLGLAVCRQIIEDHGGRMGFKTQVGYGTTFHLELPVSREEDVESAPSPALPNIKDKRVLVIDDEPDVLSFLSKVILAEGDHVERAESLQEARAIIGGKDFDLVVADVRLGEGTGINLYENWHLWSRQTRPAFLFITGDVVNQSLASEIERKGLRLLHKPIDLASFQTAVRGLLSAPPR